MVKLAEYPRTATFAWSPDKVPVLATGTASGTVDADFSSTATLEFWEVGSAESGPQGSVTADAKFNDLDWSRDGAMLAGALENGVVEFFCARERRSVARVARHTTGVRAVRFNAKQANVAVSGGSQGEIFVWDTNKISAAGYSPFGPGTAMTPIDEVQSLAWNQSLAHVFASAGSSGFASIWDLKAKKEVIHLSYTSPHSGLKNQLAVVEWHPSNSTRVATATGNDNEPVILVWDLRNANMPLQVMSQGHSKGILSLDWCKHDEKLMLSSGRDNTCILWNPEEAQKLTQYPTRGNWCFKTKFAPEAPDLFASASFDNKIQVQTLQNLANKLDLDETAFKQQESEADFWNNVSQSESKEKPVVTKIQAPAWHSKKSPAAHWAFGGKIVRITSDGLGVSVSKPHIEGFEKNVMLDEALQSKNFVPIINKRLAQTVTPTNEEDWSLLESLSMDGKDTYLQEALSFDDNEAVDSQPDTKDEDFFLNLTGQYEPSGEFELDAANPGITLNLLKGELSKAVNLALEKDLLLESLVIALNSDDDQIKQKVKNAYYTKYASNSQLARSLYAISERKIEDLVDNLNVSQWKHIVMAIKTYATEQSKNSLLIRLGDRLLQAGQRQNAVTLYLAGQSLDKVASVWLRELPALESEMRSHKNTLNEAHLEALTEFVERFTVLSAYINEDGGAKLTNEELVSKFLEFVSMASSSGDFELALKFLENLPGDNEQVKTEKQRVLIASGKCATTSATSTRRGKYGSTTVAPGVPGMPAAPMPVVGMQPPANPLADRTASYGAPGYNVAAPMPPPNGRPNPYAAPAPAYQMANPAAHGKYVNSASASPGHNTPRGSVSMPHNPYAPSTNGAGAVSHNSYAPQHVQPAGQPQNMYGVPPQRNFMNQTQDKPPVNPAATNVLSGQSPHLNRKANNGWNDLPEIVKEKKSRAKPVSTAPVAVASMTGMQASPNVTGGTIPPPPITRVTSNTSIAGSPMTPQKLSRKSSVVQTTALNAPVPVNPYAPPVTGRNAVQSPPLNPYAPSGAHAAAPPTGTYSPHLAGQAIDHTHRATPLSNMAAPPQKAMPGPPPKSMARKSTTSEKDIDSANQLLSSIQKAPNGGPPPRKQVVAPQPSVHAASPVAEPVAIPPQQQLIIEFFKEELARVTPLVPPEYNKQLKDCSKRLNILFTHIEKQDLLSAPTIEKLHTIVALLREHKYSDALAVHVDIATNHVQEAGNWLTGVKRLIGLAEATSS
ncbi:ADR090Wp [Eremothecium gossypii ATCC 10895]|uniref:Protein transport protein SEC31 n=1 Tax=Eremothecium gossypii (strain ATCC 10895 / CBS 109.51 / FGSC 9923 / NRRL Y-1056) TaxID=284811 RepID=SEC31_EREGS|nr:ADR090Wp [Eremothecium gossypii ATCC 10895]Q75A30.2 RecName: Full=Protein transport protein SEC31 [Eremothecium gossypii ATCC 10895]AAS52010.2 ADR090Wp [Eremothecium gossypii ATCC 10895]AEY96309.1 FADR090Wp [Eremothecium gossypii FDAG1]